MKKIILLIIVLSLFMFIFIKSNTWQIRSIKESKAGVEYKRTKHSLHWDRFFNYIKRLPKKIIKAF